jgi:hypothetical protein
MTAFWSINFIGVMQLTVAGLQIVQILVSWIMWLDHSCKLRRQQELLTKQQGLLIENTEKVEVIATLISETGD